LAPGENLKAKIRRRLVAVESRKYLVGEGTVSSATNTIEHNYKVWNGFDWSKKGEEWTDHVAKFRGVDPLEWKDRLVNGVLLKNIQKGSVVVEIGPGGGRWTEYLAEVSRELHLCDISDVCLNICRDRFASRDHLRYHQVSGNRLECLADQSVDAIWSYDVFVHINPNDTAGYIREFDRIMKPGAIGIVHHAGTYPDEGLRKNAFRSNVNEQLFAHLCTQAGLEMISQDWDLPHKPGDVISIFRKKDI
jgi:SAM-dependent methyltransferase